MRLFVFHHAGGSHLMYRDWPAHFPAGWQVRIPDAPGRGPLDARPAVADTAALVEHFLHELGPELTGPFGLFGHSMGGVVAYELTRRLLAEGRTLPRWVGLSARAAPHPGGESPGRHLLDDEALRRELLSMGGTPPAVLDDAELWALFAPAIRADLRVAETWRPDPSAAPLPVPLSVYGGTRDTTSPPERLTGWAARSRQFLGLHLFDGGHFYFQNDPTALTQQITRDLRHALSLPAPPASGILR